MVKQSKKTQKSKNTKKIEQIPKNQKNEEKETPGKIERDFRKELGTINPYLCLVDSAVGYLVTKTKSESNQAKFLRKIAGDYGHDNLYTDHLNLDNLAKFVHLSHIALINSKAESACKRVQEIIWTDQENDFKKDVKDYIEGDFYRKTILQIHCIKKEDSSYVKKDADKKETENIFVDYIGDTELKVLDYFRHLRNHVLHNSNEQDTNLLNEFQVINQALLNKKYNLQLNQPHNLAFTDVLLLSKVWQESVRQICGKCLNISDIYECLQMRYRGVSSKRRKNGIKETLKQDYLQTDQEISIIMDN